jgi:hypothetical protein
MSNSEPVHHKPTPKTTPKAAAKTVSKTASKALPKSAVKDTVKVKKAKLVRDSFTIPKDEFEVLALIKHRSQAAGHSVKKSEVLRAGLRLLNGLNDKALLAALKAVPTIKTGRPKNEDTEMAPKVSKAKASSKPRAAKAAPATAQP